MRGPIRQQTGQQRHRGGFTLLELLLVTVLVAVLMATAVPTFRGTLAGQQLRQGASLVSSGLAAARVTAIRTGAAQQFCYEPDGNTFWVQPYDPAAAVDPSAAGGAGASGTGVTGQRQLPAGITFSGGLGTSGAATGGSASAGGASRAATSSAQETVTFFPDGTSHDATLVLVNARGRAISVRVRGLTGLSRVGDLERVTTQP